VDETDRDVNEDQNDGGEYNGRREVRGTTCLIWFRTSKYWVFMHLFGRHTCCIRSGELTHTEDSLQFQILIMIAIRFSTLARWCPGFTYATELCPENTKLCHIFLSHHAMLLNEQSMQNRLKIDSLALSAYLSSLISYSMLHFVVYYSVQFPDSQLMNE